MRYNIYSIYNAIAPQEAVEEIDLKRYLRNESCKEGRVEKAFIDHSAISWQEDSEQISEQITSQTFACVVVGFLSKRVLEQLLQNFCQLLPKSSAVENFCQLIPKYFSASHCWPRSCAVGFPWRGAEGSERLLPKLLKLPNAHFHSFQPLTLPTPTRGTSEERADSEKLFSKSAEERGIVLSRSSHLTLYNLHFSVNWHSALYSPSSAP